MVNDLKKRVAHGLRGLPWSLIVRAVIFGGAWLILPFWAFAVLAFGMYFFPLFQPFLLFVPFLLTIVFAGLLGTSLWGAVFLGILFYLVIGIKDLILIDRRRAYHILTFLIFLALFLNFFYHYPRPDVPFAAFGLGLIFFIVFRGFVAYIIPEAGEAHRATFVSGLAALLVGQLALILLVLPLSFFYQTALLFLSVVLLAEFVIDHLEDRLDRRIVLTNASIILVFFSVVLALNRWGL
ncbi:MAG TPA: hypothetical protein VMC43_00890 [Candidatus Paceibacterota bacterium]|nr:hypothetical protein [Candidatus Paceibacterota bacterium]